MPKRSSITYFFVILIVASLILFILSKTGILNPITSPLRALFSPIESTLHGGMLQITGWDESSKIKLLKQENQSLVGRLIDQQKIVADNKALSDQFQAQNSRSSSLIPANIIGSPGFLPGISVPEVLTLDKGNKDGIKEGDAVVYKNNLIGKISNVSDFSSSVVLITNSSSLFTVKTLNTQGLGVIKGQGGGEMILDNVLLSDILEKGDFVLTKGDINASGQGFLPNLVVGEITSVSKNPSDLFQKAAIQSLVDFTKLDKVFVIGN